MPNTIKVYRIFLASPNDVQLDRESIDDVIKELNITFGKPNNIILELLKWETHSAPGISNENQQKIISADLGDDYDLFIGLLWKKFGTPTDEFESGTEEEFLNAYKRFQKNPKSLQILFYFKNSPIPPLEIDPEQLFKIQSFKNDIGKNKKVLYWVYNQIEQLNKFLRIHIPQRITDLQKQEIQGDTLGNSEKNNTAKVIEDEFGVIDYQEMIEDYMDDATQSLLRISESITWIGEQMTKKSSEINAMMLDGNQPGRKELRDLLKRTAKNMDNFASRIEPEIPIYHESFEKSIDAFSKLINISKSDLEVTKDEIDETKESLSSLVHSISDSIVSMTSFLESINGLPRLSKELNKAKSNASGKLETLLSNLHVNYSIAKELLNSID
nr:hypothetical protein [uncultured Allomuricauda sp.]